MLYNTALNQEILYAKTFNCVKVLLPPLLENMLNFTLSLVSKILHLFNFILKQFICKGKN